jgi:hypothetical protein
VHDHLDDEALEAARRRGPSYAFYVVAIAVGLLLPIVAVALYLVIALYIGVPARTVHRLLRRG